MRRLQFHLCGQHQIHQQAMFIFSMYTTNRKVTSTERVNVNNNKFVKKVTSAERVNVNNNKFIRRLHPQNE